MDCSKAQLDLDDNVFGSNTVIFGNFSLIVKIYISSFITEDSLIIAHVDHKSPSLSLRLSLNYKMLNLNFETNVMISKGKAQEKRFKWKNGFEQSY